MRFIYKFAIIVMLLNGCEKVTDLNNNQNSNRDSNGASSDVSISSSYNIEGKEIWQTCKGCHGEKGDVKALGRSEAIAGRDRETTIYQLKEYKIGALDQYGMGGVMKGQVAKLSNKDIESVATYIEKLAKLY